ncbi:MAG: FHA domain-containing protein [Saprospiraceae bacterium]|nr:FHA domain-containing protein [Saprospiraceae bacterium]
MANQNDKTVFENQVTKIDVPNEGTIFGPSNEQILSRENHKIAGVLFSFSKDLLGEYWIVYHGRNTIGSGSNSSIKLSEKSVSENHALLNCRVIDNDKLLIFELRDEGSNGGTVLNGQDLYHFNNYASLKHGDRIIIGGYDLLLYVVDDIAHDMKPNPTFKQKTEFIDY